MKSYKSENNKRLNYLKLFIFLLVLLVPGTLPAKEGRILVINSNASVGKYRVPQEEFKKAITGQSRIKEIDLAKGKINAGDLKSFDPDLVYCIGTKAYFLAHKHFKTRPVVFSSIINWLRLPTTEMTYGISNELHARMPIMMFRYLFPEIKKIGMLYSKEYTSQWFEKSSAQAKELGIRFIGGAVSGKSETLPTLETLLKKTDAVWLISDPVIIPEKAWLFDILELCDSAKKPVFSNHDAFARIGAALIVSIDDPTIGRQAAGLAREVLSGGKMDEKVRFPAGSRVTLNMKKVNKYKLKYNENALNSVNDIIQ